MFSWTEAQLRDPWRVRAIVSIYMILVYVVGADGGATVWKLVCIGITMFGIIWQVARGRSKGKNFADALVDNDSEAFIELAESAVDRIKSIASSEE